MNSVPAVFGWKMVPAFQKYKEICCTTFPKLFDIYFRPKTPKPFEKNNIFCHETQQYEYQKLCLDATKHILER